MENNKRKQINQENNIDGSLYENYLNDLFSASIIQIMLFINQQECLIKNIAEYIKIRVETWRGFVIQTRVKLSWSNSQVFSSSKPQLQSHIYILHLEFDLFDPVAPPGRAS